MISYKEFQVVVWVSLLVRSYLVQSLATVRPDHEALKCSPARTGGFGKVMKRSLQLSEVEFYTAHCTGIQQQFSDSISRQPTAGTDQTTLNDEVPRLNIDTDEFKVFYNFESGEEEKESEYCSTRKADFVPCLPKVFALADKVQETERGIPDLSDFY